MPIYEYECTNCKKHFETLQKISDPPLEKCSVCSGKLQKLVTAPAGLQFKGSGWYITDYAKKSEKSASDSKSPSDSKGEAKAPSSSESSEKKVPPPTSSPSKE